MRAGKGRHPDAEGAPAHAAFHVEARGIAPVPTTARHGTPAELFWLWVGSDLLILFPATGALLTMAGLSFAQATLAILIGNLSYAVLGLTSLQGPKASRKPASRKSPWWACAAGSRSGWGKRSAASRISATSRSST